MDRRIAGQYWELTKPRVVSLIVFTAVVGMFLAVPGLPPLRESVFGLLGIWLAAASAAAINHLIDQRIDKVMVRTANRPLATGTLQPAQVLAFAVFLGAASMTILIALVNPLTAALTFASLRSEEHTSELQSLMRSSYAVFCLTKKIKKTTEHQTKRVET